MALTFVGFRSCLAPPYASKFVPFRDFLIGSSKSMKTLLSIAVVLIFAFSAFPQSQQSARIAEIQSALQQANLDGWLFYDFRGSDILIPRILNTDRMSGSRRWYYYVPAKGEPTKVVHAIEPEKLDALPGQKLIYREWQ